MSMDSEPAQQPHSASSEALESAAREEATEHASLNDELPASAHVESQTGEPETSNAVVAAPIADRVERRELVRRFFTSACRVAVIWAIVATSIIFFCQFTFRGRWVTEYIRDNILPLGGRRMLVTSVFAGSILAALATLGIAIHTWRKRQEPERMERIAWFTAPLGLLMCFPALLRPDAWDHDLSLLIAIGLLALILEGVLSRALVVMPERLAAFLRKMRDRIPSEIDKRFSAIVVLLAVAAFIFTISEYAIRRHHRLESATYDLGISDNLMYNALVGEFMKSPIFTGKGPDATAFLANHAQFGQYLLLPFYAIRPRAETLLVIQITLLGLTAILIYLFARRHVSAWASCLIALAYLMYPAMHGAALWEMTYIPVATFFVVATALAVDAQRWWPFAFFFAAALSMREDISIGLCIMGIFCILSGRRTAMGAVLCGVSILYFAVVRFYVMDRAGTWVFPEMIFGELIPKTVSKPSFGAVLRTIVTNPFFVLKKLVVVNKLIYMLQLLVPVALLPLRRVWLMATLLPGSILTLLTTSYPPTVSLGFQYTMHFTPYIFLGVPLALVVLRDEAPHGPQRMRAALAAMLVASLIATFHYGAFGGEKFRVGYDLFVRKITNDELTRYAELSKLLEKLPRDVSVAATSRLGPHVSNRKEAYEIDDDGVSDAEYLVYWKDEVGSDKVKSDLVTMLEKGSYGVVDIQDGFALLARGHATDRNKELLQAWRL